MVEFDEIADTTLANDKAKYILRRMGKYTGGVSHIQVTIPTYLLEQIDVWSNSRSFFITLVVERYLRRTEKLDGKYPSLAELYYWLVCYDDFAAKVKREGRSAQSDRERRAFLACFKRYLRAIGNRLNELGGVGYTKPKPRVKIQDPYIRERRDRRRLEDSDSISDLGAEAFVDRTDEKNEIWRTDRDRFRQMWPSEYIERLRQDEDRREEERQDPEAWREDGDDPPEK